MKELFLKEPHLYTAEYKDKIALYSSDFHSNDVIKIRGEDFIIKKMNLLPKKPELKWTWTTWENTKPLPSLEEKITKAKSSLRSSIIEALKLDVPKEDIKDMINVAITYMVLDE